MTHLHWLCEKYTKEYEGQYPRELEDLNACYGTEPVHEKDKEDVIRFGQNIHTTQTFSKKETLKRLFSSVEGSITKLLTPSS